MAIKWIKTYIKKLEKEYWENRVWQLDRQKLIQELDSINETWAIGMRILLEGSKAPTITFDYVMQKLKLAKTGGMYALLDHTKKRGYIDELIKKRKV